MIFKHTDMRHFLLAASLMTLMACGSSKKYDASGTFETDEVIVSSELTGKILTLDIEEGDTLSRDKIV